MARTLALAAMNALEESSSESPLLPGCLYVVATPIGNLGDLSPRALAVLGAVDAICAEDTRTTGQLLAHFGIAKPLKALHEHNEGRLVGELITFLQGGRTLALVSDAGTPLVSDPGYALVDAARAAGLTVQALPGPCAVTAALSIAGLATDEFLFAGFLPAKAAARRARLEVLVAEPRTTVFYEAPHRIADCVDDLAALLGDRQVFLARELSKRFEQSVRLSASELPGWLAADANRLRGEFVLAMAGAPMRPAASLIDSRRLLKSLLGELSAAKAARIAASLTGEKRAALYALAVEMSGESPVKPLD